jgi:hypothetical protein
VSQGRFVTPRPVNEKIRDYGPGAEDKRLLKQELERQTENPVEVPMIIGGREVRSEKTGRITCPHAHSRLLAVYHKGNAECAGRPIRAAFDKIAGCIEYARTSPDADIVIGGACDDTVGYFVRPTVITTTNPKFKGMEEEIFGPVLTVYIYDDERFEETLTQVDETSPYALTGSVFGKDRTRIRRALDRLVHAAGNMYINDKPTGAVVGQQPFAGGRLSGTNDKAGGYFNLLRWTSPHVVKENSLPPTDLDYPHMAEE